jgi:hypothetical protein
MQPFHLFEEADRPGGLFLLIRLNSVKIRARFFASRSFAALRMTWKRDSG